MGHDELQQRSSRSTGEVPATELELAAQYRDRRQRVRADRRERLSEASFALLFMLAASVAYAALEGRAVDLQVAGWLALVCAVLVRVEFEVGEGCTRPVVLVLAPMLVLLPAGAVPLTVAAGHIAASLPDVVARRRPARRLLMGIGDSWFSLGPAVVVAATGVPDSWRSAAEVAAAALLAQFALDFVVSGLRARIAAGVRIRSLLRPFAWVWLVDAMLLPVGLTVAASAHDTPVIVASVVPLAGLLAVFAQERTGRIDNAMALHRMAEEGRDRLQSIVRNASDLIAIVRADGKIATLTGSVEAIFGADWASVEETLLIEYVHPEDAARVTAFLAGVAAKPAGHSQEAEWRLRYEDGSWRHVSAVATNLLDDPRVEGLVVTARDVDARKAFEEQLRHRAFHDPLTSLANRALFYDRIEHALAREQRQDGHVAVLYLDVDDFKPVNDRSGHAAGDELLVQVAARLAACARSTDTAGRLGGDEFGLLLESVSGPNEPVQAAERVLTAMSEPFTLAGESLCVSISVGIGLSDADDRGVDELLRRADLAMYAAKRNGKRRIELYDPSFERLDHGDGGSRTAWFHSSDEQREEVLSLLERHDALTMAFQPILDLRTGRVAGFEALARFEDALQRPPNAWFAQAHRCGLGYDLEAKALAAALSVPGRPAGTYLTVNLSPSALTSEAVARVLPERLDDLVIEITENEVITDDPEIFAALAAVRRRGARLAVDDTGSGYAGLTHVMRLAPDIIKLDRTLVAGVAADPVKAALIESFVRYAREIDATVCAEGIEDMPDLARLADLDVAYGQGYGLARPAPPWAGPDETAVRTCRSSFSVTLNGVARPDADQMHDQRLEDVTDRLARAECSDDVAAVLGATALELHADAIRLLTPAATMAHPAGTVAHGFWTTPLTSVRQTMAADPGAPAAEVEGIIALGFRSRLEIPIRRREATVGMLEAYAVDERAWTRFEIRRARIIANSMGAALAQVERPPTHAGTDHAPRRTPTGGPKRTDQARAA